MLCIAKMLRAGLSVLPRSSCVSCRYRVCLHRGNSLLYSVVSRLQIPKRTLSVADIIGIVRRFLWLFEKKLPEKRLRSCRSSRIRRHYTRILPGRRETGRNEEMLFCKSGISLPGEGAAAPIPESPNPGLAGGPCLLRSGSHACRRAVRAGDLRRLHALFHWECVESRRGSPFRP